MMNQGVAGNSILYNPATPNNITVTFKNRLAMVTFFNSTPRASFTIAMNPEVVQQIN
jgi:hypothetical protein